MKYIISEVTGGDISKVYHNIDDAVGSDYFYFKHLVDSQKKSYKDNDKIYTITEDDADFTAI